MPEKSNFRRPVDFHHERFTQINESYCGPAVIQMLLHHLEIEVTQEAVAEAGEASELIELNGMRVDQLSQAVRKLAPQTCFWYKDHSLIEELAQIVTDYDYVVGIEWQGLFEDKLEDETRDGDYGHYSLVTIADVKSRELVIADPYKDFRSQDRILNFDFFISRWWDTNEYPDHENGKARIREDRQMMFLITAEGETFPRDYQMKGYCDLQD